MKLDFRHFADGYVATAADVEAEFKRIGHALKPLEIVVVNTSAGLKYGQPDYVASGCGMGAEATLYLLGARRARDRHRRLELGTRLSFTPPKRYALTHDASLIWEGHKAGRHIGYSHIEKLHNLEALPADGFMISCFPTKIAARLGGLVHAPSRSSID